MASVPLTFAGRRSMRVTLVALATAAFSGAAPAALTITSVVGGASTGVFYVNFDALPLGSAGGSSGGLAVSFASGAGTEQGASGNYAPPFLSNSNGLLFGDPTVAGADTTRYLATTSSGGTATLAMPGPELYFGLLWGSVDTTNVITFVDAAGAVVGRITGSDVTTNANGNQGAAGTFYVNITSTLPFSKVIASGTYFEFDNVAYNPSIPVPEPSAAGLCLLGLGLLAHRLRALGACRAR